jgi:hypothetical protein
MMAAMDEAAHGLQNLLARIGAFFDIFDLSFFVSGVACVAALGFCYRKLEGDLLAGIDSAYLVLGLVIGSYALGLVCFTLGRTLRQLILAARYRQRTAIRFRRSVDAVVRAHGLDKVALGKASERTPGHYLHPAGRPDAGVAAEGAQQLYMLLWTKLRQSPHLQPSLQLLNRYWVMAATYDGMAVAALLWALVLLLWWRGIVLPVAGTPLPGAAAVVCVGLCWLYLREAERYTRVQLGELVATLAWDYLAGAGGAPAAGGSPDAGSSSPAGGSSPADGSGHNADPSSPAAGVNAAPSPPPHGP